MATRPATTFTKWRGWRSRAKGH